MYSDGAPDTTLDYDLFIILILCKVNQKTNKYAILIPQTYYRNQMVILY